MSQTKSASLGDLRAIAHALCEDDNIKKQLIDDLQLLRNPRARKDYGEVTDHVALIEQTPAWKLSIIPLIYINNEDTKTRVENYLQVLRYTKPAEATPAAADSPDPIKTATPKELRNVMLALCEDDDAKKRATNHLLVLRRSKTGGASTAGADPDAPINSATEMELRAIGIAMSDADENIKKRLLESLHVLSIFLELQGTEAKYTTFKCLRCREYFHEKDNKAQSCTYHPG
ncbi:hypothetical protein INS49_002767 [Diaporthe citri]|uniref:uncharacterized protein n=1 Tax=Diaporthe citri TaxID=83186 RepID=UPI001C8141B7|nr:uncharacterized protein INS49_002767 [Diaporthe citri]KAG6368554.1 hypothetical protein INS49_002767 [Diaporthe citri]